MATTYAPLAPQYGVWSLYEGDGTSRLSVTLAGTPTGGSRTGFVGTTGNIYTFVNGVQKTQLSTSLLTVATRLDISDTTDTASPSTNAALKVLGGVSIAKSVAVGGNFVDIGGTGTSGYAALRLYGASGTARALQLHSGTSLRWNILGNATADSSTATGTDLEFNAHNNVGVLVGTALKLTRSNLRADFGGRVEVASTADSSSSTSSASGKFSGGISAAKTVRAQGFAIDSGDVLDTYVEHGTAWTPGNDDVTYLAVGAVYGRTGNVVYISGSAKWPVNADANSAVVTNLPVTPKGGLDGSAGLAVAYTSSGIAMSIFLGPGNYFTLYGLDGDPITNAELSNSTVYFGGAYCAA